MAQNISFLYTICPFQANCVSSRSDVLVSALICMFYLIYVRSTIVRPPSFRTFFVASIYLSVTDKKMERFCYWLSILITVDVYSIVTILSLCILPFGLESFTKPCVASQSSWARIGQPVDCGTTGWSLSYNNWLQAMIIRDQKVWEARNDFAKRCK